MYYVVEEPDSLHSDRSPYDFEPADTHTSLSSQVADYTQSGYTQKNSGDFVIKEHSYTMCPGCPTFRYIVHILAFSNTTSKISGISVKAWDGAIHAMISTDLSHFDMLKKTRCMAVENRTFWPLCDSQNQLQLFVYFMDTTFIFSFSVFQCQFQKLLWEDPRLK